MIVESVKFYNESIGYIYPMVLILYYQPSLYLYYDTKYLYSIDIIYIILLHSSSIKYTNYVSIFYLARIYIFSSY